MSIQRQNRLEAQMPNFGKVQDSIQWYEGMLLLPEHFQQAEQRQNQLMHFHINHAVSHYWGVSHVQFDPALLIAGTLRIMELRAVMPDGLVVTLDENNGDSLELNIKNFANEMQNKPLTVHLAVPKFRPGCANSKDDFPRYHSKESAEVVDLNTGRGNISYPTLKPNLTLIAGDTIPSRYESFPICKISRESNTFELTSYSPPVLRVNRTSELCNLCSVLAQKIREKIAFLSERLHNEGSQVMSAEAENAVRALSGGLLPFEALIQSNIAHPFQLYLALCTIAGHVSALQPGQMPPSFDDYDHDNVRASFLQAIHYIHAMLERIQEGYSIIPFKLFDRDFRLQLRHAWMNNRLICGAKASAGMSEKDLVNWIDDCVIATDRFVLPSRDKRVLGASRKTIEGVEEMKLFPAMDVVLFSIENDENFIDPEETLHMFNVADTEDMRPIELVLYVPKQTEEVFF